MLLRTSTFSLRPSAPARPAVAAIATPEATRDSFIIQILKGIRNTYVFFVANCDFEKIRAETCYPVLRILLCANLDENNYIYFHESINI